MSETKRYAAAIAAMLFAAFMQWLSLALFDSLALSFLLYTLIACLGLPAADLLFARKTPPGRLLSVLGLGRSNPRQALYALLLGLGMDGIMFGAFFLLGPLFLREGRAIEVVKSWGIGPGPVAWIYFFALTLNGAVEEIFWRGYLHRLLADSPRRVLAVSLPAFVFGAQHIFVISRLVPNPPSVALFMFAIIASGFLWGIVYEKARSLIPCVVCHAVVAMGYLGILGMYLFSS